MGINEICQAVNRYKGIEQIIQQLKICYRFYTFKTKTGVYVVGFFFTVAHRMDGFKLCVTNTSTTPPDSDACYEDPGPGLPNIIQTISWNKLGKYVIYYDDKGSQQTKTRYDSPVIELCYVAINGRFIEIV